MQGGVNSGWKRVPSTRNIREYYCQSGSSGSVQMTITKEIAAVYPGASNWFDWGEFNVLRSNSIGTFFRWYHGTIGNGHRASAGC